MVLGTAFEPYLLQGTTISLQTLLAVTFYQPRYNICALLG